MTFDVKKIKSLFLFNYVFLLCTTPPPHPPRLFGRFRGSKTSLHFWGFRDKKRAMFSLAELSYDMQKITKIFLNKLDLPQSD